MMKLLKHQGLTITWALLVLYLCNMHMDQHEGASFFEGFDKLVHTGFFFVLSTLMFFGCQRQGITGKKPYVVIVPVMLLSISFGGIIELIQWKIFTYRSADWWDFFCDALGVCMAIFCYLMFYCWGVPAKQRQ